MENLVSDSAIEAISGGSEYQVPHYAAPDISRRELAAPSGVRYLRKPDENEGIDADGTVYRTSSLSQYKSHTWRRNSGSIAVALCCGLGAQANHGYDADLGQFAPTAVQTDKMAQTVALLVTALGLQLTIDTVMTHCEAALLDGYGPYSGDAETRWDLWYMRDSPGDGQMKPGGDILRGKARWYLEHSKI